MFCVTTISEAGGHRVNEDAFVARAHPAHSDAWVICLADGQGGRAGGARAAQLAFETAADLATKANVGDLVDFSASQRVLTRADWIVAADRGAGYTTLIGLGSHDGRIAGASCGDSAAGLFSGGMALELTARQVKNPPVGRGDPRPLRGPAVRAVAVTGRE